MNRRELLQNSLAGAALPLLGAAVPASPAVEPQLVIPNGVLQIELWGRVLGYAEGSVSITREVAALYDNSGSTEPKAFVKGKRAIAGTLRTLWLDEREYRRVLRRMRLTGTEQVPEFGLRFAETTDRENSALIEGCRLVDTEPVTLESLRSERALTFVARSVTTRGPGAG